MAIPDRGTIQKLWQIKKLIREEFDVNVSIHQKDLHSQLDTYQQQSRNPQLLQLIRDIIPSSPIDNDSTVLTDAPDDGTPDDGTTPPSSHETTSTKRTIIYRGRRVEQEEPA